MRKENNGKVNGQRFTYPKVIFRAVRTKHGIWQKNKNTNSRCETL